MNELRLVICDASRSIHETRHGSFADRVVAALARSPRRTRNSTGPSGAMKQTMIVDDVIRRGAAKPWVTVGGKARSKMAEVGFVFLFVTTAHPEFPKLHSPFANDLYTVDDSQSIPQDHRMNKRRSRFAPALSVVNETLESRIVLSGLLRQHPLHHGAAEVAAQDRPEGGDGDDAGGQRRDARPADHVHRDGAAAAAAGSPEGTVEHHSTTAT